MTDSVKGVSGIQGTSAGGKYSGGSSSGDHKKKGMSTPQTDLVEISKDAHERSIGKGRKNILEYLKELFG
jgi:hypothetical protein